MTWKMCKKHQLLQTSINHFSFAELYITSLTAKVFGKGSLTAVGHAGYQWRIDY